MSSGFLEELSTWWWLWACPVEPSSLRGLRLSIQGSPITSNSTSVIPVKDVTYLLPEFLCLFVLFSSREEEEEEGGASTRTGPATSEPQRQKPFPCSINFIGKSVSLGGGVVVVHFFAPPVTHRERAR